MSTFVAAVEIKQSTKHVEATIDVVSGRGFDSPRLHSTRCARSWQAMPRHKAGINWRRIPDRKTSSESNALSSTLRLRPEGNKQSASKGLNLVASAPADSFLLRLPMANTFYVYILRCSDESLYVGHTTDVDARLQAHNYGRGALWTARRRPVTLAYHESLPSEDKAVARERQIKRWTHAKKLALIGGDLQKLKVLARRRIR